MLINEDNHESMESPSFYELSVREQAVIVMLLCSIYLSAQFGGIELIAEYLINSLDMSVHAAPTSRAL